MARAFRPVLRSRPLTAILAAAAWWLSSTLPSPAEPAQLAAPNAAATPFNQLSVSGNACGPAALLNAYRMGDATWQRGLLPVPGETDKARLLAVIRTWGQRPSTSLPGRKRWSRNGINADDLCALANEVTRPQILPQVKCEIFLTTPRETQSALVQRVHARFAASLRRGLPPVISVRRIALRHPEGKPPEWVVLQGHFVTLTSLPAKLPRDAVEIPVTYLDPWGGRRATGRLRVSDRAFVTAPGTLSPCLEADFPTADVGKKQVRSGETTVLTLAAGIGKW